MASATRKATEAMKTAIASVKTADVKLGEDILAAARVIGDSSQFLGLLSDPARAADEKAKALKAVFTRKISAAAIQLLAKIVAQPWSSDQDLLAGIEEAGIRVISAAAPEADLEGEIFAIGTAVSGNAELELNLGSKLVPAAAKSQLVDALFADNVSFETLAIMRHLVQQPRSRRIGKLVDEATRIVADQRGHVVATVTGITALTDAQRRDMEQQLSQRTGRSVRLNYVVDPSLLGGVRVRLGDEVIDGSVATRIAELRQQLVG